MANPASSPKSVRGYVNGATATNVNIHSLYTYCHVLGLNVLNAGYLICIILCQLKYVQTHEYSSEKCCTLRTKFSAARKQMKRRGKKSWVWKQSGLFTGQSMFLPSPMATSSRRWLNEWDRQTKWAFPRHWRVSGFRHRNQGKSLVLWEGLLHTERPPRHPLREAF